MLMTHCIRSRKRQKHVAIGNPPASADKPVLFVVSFPRIKAASRTCSSCAIVKLKNPVRLILNDGMFRRSYRFFNTILQSSLSLMFMCCRYKSIIPKLIVLHTPNYTTCEIRFPFTQLNSHRKMFK